MNSMPALVFVAMLAAVQSVGSASRDEAPSDAWHALVEAERSFARTSLEKGMRAAFLDWLAEGSIVFRPQPVEGRQWYTDRPDAPGTLSWGPVHAEVSAAGDLGWTSGPFSYTPRDPAQPAGYGHYSSVWGLDTHGNWRVLVDAGISHPDEVPLREPTFPRHNRAGAVRPDPERHDPAGVSEALLAEDREFAARAARQGLRKAYRRTASDDIWLLRDGVPPLTGAGSLDDALSRQPGDMQWEPSRAGASRSGALGYTVGRFEGGDRQGSYLRVWRRTGHAWRVVLDVLNFDPPPPQQP